MNALEKAKRIRTNFNRRLRRLNDKILARDEEAPLKLIQTLTAQNEALKAVGYQLDDSGKLEKRTSAVIKRNKKVYDRINRARKNPLKLIRTLAQQTGC